MTVCSVTDLKIITYQQDNFVLEKQDRHCYKSSLLVVAKDHGDHQVMLHQVLLNRRTDLEQSILRRRKLYVKQRRNHWRIWVPTKAIRKVVLTRRKLNRRDI